MDHKVEIREIEPIRAAYMKYRGDAAKANRMFPKVFQSVRGKTNGSPFFSYLSMDPETKMGNMELCVPTQETPAGSSVNVKVFPRIRALCVTHTCSYDTLFQAYAAIDHFAAEHHLVLRPPFREIFLKGPGMIIKGNPDKYITEIQFPIEED